MENPSRLILLFFVLIPCFFGLTFSAPAEFIHSSCKVTQYPTLCEKYLSVYPPAVQRSPSQLAKAALNVTANRALAVSNFIKRMPVSGKDPTERKSHGGGAVRDCLETLNDSVDRLRRSVTEVERMGRYGSRSFKWHLSNAQTWVSAALTDQNTCLDSLLQDKSAAGVRVPIRRQIVAVSQLTSNALALVNRLDSRN
ncbi:21 kDa protein [Dendrobium catenatum]|uniref:21 kDa protein n=1 Tax=Dendrobium catenatum TaxID=906689 RepID=A0A2I0X1D5_9ASPA|nr:21 kDa protein [Dendrobium catenatum]PKU81725.1 21 kDa protein [Dendrobium catenatum]